MAKLIDSLTQERTRLGRLLFIAKAPNASWWRRLMDAYGVLIGRYTAVTFAEDEYHKNSRWLDNFAILSDFEVAQVKELATKELIFKAIPDININRNDPCPCGSGKKFKKCCGKNT